MSCGLGPFDEVGDDQEVARIVHAGDDVELEGEPRRDSPPRVMPGDRPCTCEPAARAPPRPDARSSAASSLTASERRGGADGEARQDRLARLRPERAALGDLDRRGQRLRQVGEQHRHLGAGLEAMIGRELLAVGLGDQLAAGDAQQRVMGLVIVGRWRNTARWSRPAAGPWHRRDRSAPASTRRSLSMPWRCNST